MRTLIAIHRYLGIATGWLVVLWCVSGIVMIYVPYPAVSLAEHVEALPELELRNCCVLDLQADWLAELEAADFSIAMHAGRPVLRVGGRYGDSLRFALDSGEMLGDVDAAEAVAIAAERTAHWAGRGPVAYLGATARDQWTVGYFRPERTLHHIAINDAAGTEWYIDSRDGTLVQATTGVERAWNRVGAVLHWLYLTPLRALGPVWANIVIWSTLVALALTVIGIYVGVARMRFGTDVSLSPYRGLAMWHHVLGLAFGILTLTWLFSGLMSMNPWGLLSGPDARIETARLAGTPTTLNELAGLLERHRGQPLPPGTTYLEAAPFLGKLYLIAHDRRGGRQRLDAGTLAASALGPGDLDAAARALRPETQPLAAELMHQPDAYYYDHKSTHTWPVYRVRYADADRYYIDPATGQLLGRIDSAQRAYRWLFTALHSLDFAGVLRVRPIWDAAMITLLAGVVIVSATGTWLGWRYLRRRSGRV